MACVVVPWFADRYADGADWRSLAYWIHDHLPYSKLQFFPKLAAFNTSWHERPARSIYSFIKPAGYCYAADPPATASLAATQIFPSSGAYEASMVAGYELPMT